MAGIRQLTEDSLRLTFRILPGRKYRYPDVLVESKTSFTVGDTEFLLNPARGETDDHLWAFIPKEKILLPGDLFIWAVPNGGNPQKVQRYFLIGLMP